VRRRCQKSEKNQTESFQVGSGKKVKRKKKKEGKEISQRTFGNISGGKRRSKEIRHVRFSIRKKGGGEKSCPGERGDLSGYTTKDEVQKGVRV